MQLNNNTQENKPFYPGANSSNMPHVNLDGSLSSGMGEPRRGNDLYNSPLIDNSPGKPPSRLRMLWSRMGQRLIRIAKFISITAFIGEFIKYLGVRFKIVFVLSSVMAEVLTKQFEIIKNFLVRRMFWGRGNLFKLSIQFVAALLVVSTIILSGYRSRLTEAAVTDKYIALSPGYGEDLIVQNSSTTTVASDIAVRYEQKIYVVKGGDTLSKIAQAFDINVDSILWANDLTAYDVLQPGMELKIPPENGLFITVKKGDTIESLAKKYGTHEQQIVTYNVLEAPFNLVEGQRIFLPGGEKEDIPVVRKDAPIFSGIISGRASGGTGTARGIDPSIGRFLAWPVAGGSARVTQCFGGYHNGVDIASKSSPDLLAAAPGIVTLAGCQSGNCPQGEVGGSGLAWTVIVDHGNGFSSVYAHMSTGDIYVKSGQAVARGQRLGRMGQSGTAYGIHVHFMLLKSGTWTWYNPAPYMMNNLCGY